MLKYPLTKKEVKEIKIKTLTDAYEVEFYEIIEEAHKKGFRTYDIQNNPILLLHFFYEWVQRKF